MNWESERDMEKDVQENPNLYAALADKIRRVRENGPEAEGYIPLEWNRPLLDMADTGDADDDFERAVTDAQESLDHSTDRHDRRREDLLAGFGRWSDEKADRVRKNVERSREKSKERMRRLSDE